MNQADFPGAVYIDYIKELTAELNLLKQRKNLVAWTRLIIILLLIAAVWYLHNVNTTATIVISIVLIAVFTRLIIIATNYNNKIENTRVLIDINEQEIAIANGQYHQMPDGAAFLYPTHPYANDLDINQTSQAHYVGNTVMPQVKQGNMKALKKVYSKWK